MGKAYVELKYRQRKYKLNAEDIGKVYRIAKRTALPIPNFHFSNKPLPETDDDCEPTVELAL